MMGDGPLTVFCGGTEHQVHVSDKGRLVLDDHRRPEPGSCCSSARDAFNRLTRKHGRTPDTAAKWVAAGARSINEIRAAECHRMTPETVGAWWRELPGVDFKHILNMETSGLTLSEYRKWADAGVSIGDRPLDWWKAQFTPPTALPWITAGVPPDLARAAIRQQHTPAETGVAFRSAHRDLQRFGWYIEQDWDLIDAAPWIALGVNDPLRASAFASHAVTAAQVAAFDNIVDWGTPSEMNFVLDRVPWDTLTAWVRGWRDPREVRRWTTVGWTTPEDAGQWRTLGYRPATAYVFHRHGLSCDDATWLMNDPGPRLFPVACCGEDHHIRCEVINQRRNHRLIDHIAAVDQVAAAFGAQPSRCADALGALERVMSRLSPTRNPVVAARWLERVPNEIEACEWAKRFGHPDIAEPWIARYPTDPQTAWLDATGCLPSPTADEQSSRRHLLAG